MTRSRKYGVIWFVLLGAVLARCDRDPGPPPPDAVLISDD